MELGNLIINPIHPDRRFHVKCYRFSRSIKNKAIPKSRPSDRGSYLLPSALPELILAF
jgi:hypothetical protein